MSFKWQINAGVTILNVFIVCLIIIQISNTQFHCFSNDLQNCRGRVNPDDAQCVSPGSFIGQLTDSETQDYLNIYCPWSLWRTLKVILVSVAVLIIINWYSLRLILNKKWNILIFAASLGIIIPLMLASGIMDIVHIYSSDCSNDFITDQTSASSCDRIWFYINAVLQIFGAVLIGVACATMMKWRKCEDKGEDTSNISNIEEQSGLIHGESLDE